VRLFKGWRGGVEGMSGHAFERIYNRAVGRE
jgi:hypothetical protein